MSTPSITTTAITTPEIPTILSFEKPPAPHKKPAGKQKDRFLPSSDRKTRNILSQIMIPESPTLYQKQLFKAVSGRSLPTVGQRMLSASLPKVEDEDAFSTTISAWNAPYKARPYTAQNIKLRGIVPFAGYNNDYYLKTLSISPDEGMCYTIIENCCYRFSDKDKLLEVIHKFPPETKLTSIEILNSNTVVVAKKASTVPHLLVASMDTKGTTVSEVTFSPVAEVSGKINVICRLSNTEFLTGHHDGAVCHANTLTGVTTKIAAHNGPICSIVMDESSSKIAIGDNNGFVKVYDRYDHFKMIAITQPSLSAKRAVAWLPGSSNLLLIGGGLRDGKIYIYNLEKNTLTVETGSSLDLQITNILFIDTNVCAVTYGFGIIPSGIKIELFTVSKESKKGTSAGSKELNLEKFIGFCKGVHWERVLSIGFSKFSRRLYVLMNREVRKENGELSIYEFVKKTSLTSGSTSLLDKLTIK